MKKAQDFLVDSALGGQSFKLDTGPQEEKIVLTIEENAVPEGLMQQAARTVRQGKRQSFFARLNDGLQSLGKPSAKDKATFFRLMSIMINAGVPLIRSLDTIAEQTVNKFFKKALFDIARLIEKGTTFSDSLKSYTDIFSEAHVGMIHAAEASGQLNQILKQLALEVEKSASIRKKVRSALMYPVFIVIVMIAVVAGMMIAVVPKIATIFTDSGRALPTLTRVVIATSNFLATQWPYLFIGLIILIAGFFTARRIPTGRFWLDWIALKMPIFGGIIKHSILARFSRTLGNLLVSGVPIVQSLLINAKTLGNELYRRRVELAAEDVGRGIPLGESLRDSPEFPAMMVQMISVGEQTAQLDSITDKIAQYYEEEVDVTVGNLSKLLEPVIMTVLGVVVGGIIGAIMLPIIQLSQISG